MDKYQIKKIVCKTYEEEHILLLLRITILFLVGVLF